MKRLVLLLVLLCWASHAGAVTYTATANGNWTSTTTWSGSAGTYPGQNSSGSADTVNLGNATVALNTSPNAFASLTTTGSGSLTVSTSATSYTLTVGSLGSLASHTVIVATGSAGYSFTVNGNVSGGSASTFLRNERQLGRGDRQR